MSLSIAIIGTGIAGLTAAHRCRQAGSAVTLFESHPGLGMDAHALAFQGGLVDVPLRVMSPGHWQRLLALVDDVGVETFAVDANISCNWSDGSSWFRSRRLPVIGWPVAGSWRFLNTRAVRLGAGLARLAAKTRKLSASDSAITLGEWSMHQRFDPLFWRGLVLPILATICTCREQHLLNWPARPLLELFHSIVHSDELCRLRGGTGALARALADGIDCHSSSQVIQVELQGKQVLVRNDRGEGGLFDRVIVATQANQLGFLDPKRFADEVGLLAQIPYDTGELWVHHDAGLMPNTPSNWTALNLTMDRQLQHNSFTVWVNALEPTLSGADPVFQTWNPPIEPKASKTLARIPMQRAVVNPNTAHVLKQLQRWHALEGRQVFYVGSWAWPGVPLLETAVRSAEAVVEQIHQVDSNKSIAR